MMRLAFKALFLASTFSYGLAAIGDDHIATVPPTVYESSDISPQNADYDSTNKMFIAHPGWLNNKEVFYYKFRVYAPSTYNGVIKGPPEMSTSSDVPIQDIHFTTTTGDFTGVVGKPIIQYHHVDGVTYSDFMRVNFITITDDYIPDSLKSVGDVVDQSLTPVATDMILNLPVVPTGATLQHPTTGGTTKAPIDPFMVYYKGQMVTTYVFEVTDQAAKDYFDPRTRSDGDDDYAVTVSQFGSGGDSVFSIPLWHVNQYSRGVAPGEGGGPSPDGMRNIINLDRGDAGYSPLWQLFWLTEMPVNYSADQVSHKRDMTSANGFEWAITPMFVNCPDIGPVGTEDNPLMEESFMLKIDTEKESNWILGSHMSLIFQKDVEITFKAGPTTGVTARSTTNTGTTIATTKTNGMGAFEYELMSSAIPEGTKVISVMSGETVIQDIDVMESTVEPNSSASSYGFIAGAVASIAVFLVL